ncbi:MAG: hypothetical protein HOQ02_08495 [Lysobacter sp.]|nr:hypothetical protein [Lysobacter sp.]
MGQRTSSSNATRAAVVLAVACAALAWWLPAIDDALPGGAFGWQWACVALAVAAAAWAWRRLAMAPGGRVARIVLAMALVLATLWLLGLAALWLLWPR